MENVEEKAGVEEAVDDVHEPHMNPEDAGMYIWWLETKYIQI